MFMTRELACILQTGKALQVYGLLKQMSGMFLWRAGRVQCTGQQVFCFLTVHKSGARGGGGGEIHFVFKTKFRTTSEGELKFCMGYHFIAVILI